MTAYPNVSSRRIWIIGGTQESAQIARMLEADFNQDRDVSCVVTVTTAVARALYPVIPTLQVRVGQLKGEQINSFLKDQNICAILDASHPYATEISKQAIAAAQLHHIPYLRFERPALVTSTGVAPDHLGFPSFEALLSSDRLLGQRVLLIVGYRPLALFRPWQEKAVLFARILPSPIALDAALEAGFTPDRLIALRPPVSAELEQALWRQWQISTVVIKASGQPGGEDVKQRVAAESGIPLVTIDRPAVTYPQQTSDLTTAITFCQQHLSSSTYKDSLP